MLDRKRIGKFTKFYKAWGRNAKAMSATHPFWGIPLSWVFFYRPIFMKEAVGLSEIQIGLLSSVLAFFAVVGPVSGGYLADRFGRKKIFIFFDNFGWLSSLFVWIFTTNIWLALLAYVLEGFVSVVFSVWECILIEDTKPKHRASIYASIVATMYVGTLSMPIAGSVIGLYGIDFGSRLIFFVAFLSIIPLLVFRQKYVQETELGYKIRNDEAFRGLKGYFDSLSMIKRSRVLIILLLTYFIGNVYSSVTIYLPLLLTDNRGLGLSNEIASLIPTAYSVSALFIALAVVPRLTERKGYLRALIASYSLGGLALIFLVYSPTGYLPIALLCGGLLGVYLALAFSVSRTFLTNEIETIDNRARAKITSIIITFSAILNLPTPALAGYLFSIDPKLPFLALAAMLIIGAVVVNLHLKRHESIRKQNVSSAQMSVESIKS